jgi:hypothetical protein
MNRGKDIVLQLTTSVIIDDSQFLSLALAGLPMVPCLALAKIR